MKKRSNGAFSTTKNEDSLTERKYLGKQIGRLLEEMGAQKEYHEEGTRSVYLQFLLIIGQPLFLIRILKAKIRRNEFRL